ncbi:BTB and MATH domain-containing protein 15-like isoform X2 [Stylophora pistillata]|nr:BTB and MATH domain-containing protein 15-like isoform X2 [Stylophora pistillata]
MDLFNHGDQLPKFSEPWNFSDTVLVVEDKRFHVHRSILAISSPVFNTMFQSSFKEATSTEIPFPGKKAEKIYELLCMIYPFPLQISDQHDVRSLLELSREYQISKLSARCEERLLQKQSSVELVILAQEFSLTRLLEKCLASLARMNIQELKNSPNFDNIEAENLVSLLNNHLRWLKEQHAREIRQLREQFLKEKGRALEIANELNSCWGYNKLPIRGCACASYTKSCDNCCTVLEKFVKTKCGELIEALQQNV